MPTLDKMTRFNLAKIVQLIDDAVNREDIVEKYPNLPTEFLKHKAAFLETGIDQQAMLIINIYQSHVRRPFIENAFYMPDKKRRNEEQRIAFAVAVINEKREEIEKLFNLLTTKAEVEISSDFIDALLREHAAYDNVEENHILSDLLVRISLFEDILQEFTMAEAI